MRSCEAVVPPVEGGEAEEVDLIVVVSMSCKKSQERYVLSKRVWDVRCVGYWLWAVGVGRDDGSGDGGG